MFVFFSKERAVVVILLLLFYGCEPAERVSKLPARTTIVYMVADNNLDSFAMLDINEMEEAWQDNIDGNLLVYIDRAEGATTSHPVVLDIKHDTTTSIESNIVRSYPEQNSCDKEVLKNVLQEIVGLYPAQSYGLVLWSHGTAWLPEAYDMDGTEQTPKVGICDTVFKSFGRDGANELNFIDLAQVLPLKFEYIAFDACFMGSVEVAYQLKDCADYLLVSPAEILSEGYPYNRVIPLLMTTPSNLPRVAEAYVDYYDKQTDVQRTATISVICTAYLAQLHSICRTIYADNKSEIDVRKIQQFDSRSSYLFFDLDQYIQQTASPDNYIKFCKALSKVVVYKRTTASIYNQLTVNRYSGLSVYIPNNRHTELNVAYSKLPWNN